MEEKFIKFVAEIMDVNESEISMNTAYKQFSKWDSMMFLNIIMELEEMYNVSISIEAAAKVQTLADLYKIVQGE